MPKAATCWILTERKLSQFSLLLVKVKENMNIQDGRKHCGYTGWTDKHTTDIHIQSEYFVAVSTDDEQNPFEHSLAGNVYSDLRGEQLEYATVNKPKKTLLPVKVNEPPQQPVNGRVKTSLNPGSSPSEEALPVYAQPDLSKKKKHS